MAQRTAGKISVKAKDGISDGSRAAFSIGCR